MKIIMSVFVYVLKFADGNAFSGYALKSSAWKEWRLVRYLSEMTMFAFRIEKNSN